MNGAGDALRTEKINAQREGKKDGGLLYAELYECKFTMYGNPMIRNGMYVFLSPRSLGLPDTIPQRITALPGSANPYIWAEAVGIGGYYIATRVDGVIDSSGYAITFRGTPESGLQFKAKDNKKITIQSRWGKSVNDLQKSVNS